MRTMITSRTALFVLLVVSLFVVANSDKTRAQQPLVRHKTFSGPYDSEYPYPIAEGKAGQKDPAALAEIRQSMSATALPEQTGIEAQGVLTRGSGKTERQSSASFVIENGSRFRMDVQEKDNTSSIRIDGRAGQAKWGNKTIESLDDIEFGYPLALPSQLLEIASRKDAAVVDDGVFVVGEHRMNKVTITLFMPRLGNPVSSSFYFNASTHFLEKSTFVNHSATNRSLEYLEIVTYEDYRQDQSVMIPHEYLETVNGQLVMTMKITGASVTSRHDDSYFTF